MKTREYDVTFQHGQGKIVQLKSKKPKTETLRVRAQNQAGAKELTAKFLDVYPDEIKFISVKAVRGSVQEGGPPPVDEGPGQTPPDSQETPAEKVKRQIESAKEFSDDYNIDAIGAGGDIISDDRGPDDPGPVDNGPRKLSRAEWKILRECVLLDENDADNGKRLLKWFGKDMIHVQEQGWHMWTGTHWDSEHGQHAIERFAHLVVGRIKREAALIEFSKPHADLIAEVQKMYEDDPKGDDFDRADRRKIKYVEDLEKALGKRRSARFNFGVRSGDRSRTRAMIDQAEPHQSFLHDALDQDDIAINCLNGTVRIKMVEGPESEPDWPVFVARAFLDKHNPSDMFTKITGAEYIPGAKAPKFLRDLQKFMPDKLMQDFLQVFMGYVALGLTGEQVYAFFYGDGANWKSAFLQAIARTMGSYYKPMNYTSVSGNNMPTGDKPSPDWARLSGVRMLTIEEVPRKVPIKEELVKLVTSGTPLPVRHLNKGMFDLVAKFVCIMTSNAEPNISGHDKGIWRRTLIVPWDVTIPENERLPFDQVMAGYDEERAGIFNWLVEGAKMYRENGLQAYVTQRMREFTDSVRADRDAAGSFIEDCVTHAEGEHVTAGDLYKAFVVYCQANGIDPILNSTAFGRQVKRVDVNGTTMERRKHKIQGIRRFKDIIMHDIPDSTDQDQNYGDM